MGEGGVDALGLGHAVPCKLGNWFSFGCGGRGGEVVGYVRGLAELRSKVAGEARHTFNKFQNISGGCKFLGAEFGQDVNKAVGASLNHRKS